MKRRLQAFIAVVVPVWIAASGGFAVGAFASIQDDDICWSPDVEFPTTCDEDDD